jgi:hypothetical protein
LLGISCPQATQQKVNRKGGHMRKRLVCWTMLALCAAAAWALTDDKAATATKAKSTSEHKMAAAPKMAYTPAEMQWGEGPPFLPAGAKLAVLEGDPGKAGAFTVRLRLPDGYAIAPHWHPTREQVTVISGTFNIGMGDTLDKTKTAALPAGSFGFVNPKMHHYAYTTGETELQVQGMGPFAVHYVNAADDPRKATKTEKK